MPAGGKYTEVTDQSLIDELNAEADKPIADKVDESLANKLPIDKRELVMAQLRHETGKADLNSNVAQENNNVSGITWNDNFPEEWKGTPRPAKEGGNYVHFPTYEDWAIEHMKLLNKDSGAGKPIDADNIQQFAHRLKKNGYYTDNEVNYAQGMQSMFDQYGQKSEEVTDPTLLAELNGDTTPQKKSPDVSVPGSAPSSSDGQQNVTVTNQSAQPYSWNGPVNASDQAPAPQQSFAGIPQPEVKQTTPLSPQEEMTNAAHVLSSDVINNDESIAAYKDNLNNHPFADPKSVIYTLSDPHGDPNFTGQYVQYRLSQLKQQRDASMATDPSAPAQYAAKAKQLLDAGKTITGLQLAYQANQKANTQPASSPDSQPTVATDWQNPTATLSEQPVQGVSQGITQSGNAINTNIGNEGFKDPYNATRLGMEQAATLGDQTAKSDLVKLNNQTAPIPAERKIAYQAAGLNLLQQGAKTADAGGNNEVAAQLNSQSDDIQGRLEKDNPEYFKHMAASALGSYVYNHVDNPVYTTIFGHPKLTQSEINEYGKDAGIADKWLKQLKPEDIPTAASAVAQGAQSLFNTFLFKNENDPYGKFFTGEVPIEQQQVNNFRGVVGEVAKVGGMIAATVLQAGIAGKALKGVGVLGDVAANAQRYEQASNLIPIAAMNYNQSYQASHEIFGDNTGDEWKRQMYSIGSGALSTALMSIDPATALGKEAVSGTSKGFVDFLKQANIGDVSEEALKEPVQQWTTKALAAAGVTAEHVGKQAFIMAANQVSDNIINTIVDPKHRGGVMDGAGTAAVHAAIGFFIPSLFAGLNAGAEQSGVSKSMLMDIGLHPDKYTAQVNQLHKEGKITNDEYTNSINNITRASTIYQSQVPKVSPATNEPLTQKQQEDYGVKLLQEQQLQQASDATDDKVQQAAFSNKIRKLQDERGSILEESQADATDEENKINVSELIGKKVLFHGEPSTLEMDEGGEITATNKDGKSVIIGQSAKIGDQSAKQYGIEEIPSEQSVVGVKGDNITVRGKEYELPDEAKDNPLAAINYHNEPGKKGVPISVTLNQKNDRGIIKKVTFRGNVAEDIMYQLHLKKLDKDNNHDKLENFINTDQQTNSQVQDGRLAQTATQESTGDNGAVSTIREPQSNGAIATEAQSGSLTPTTKESPEHTAKKAAIQYSISQLEDDYNSRVNDLINKGATKEDAEHIADQETPQKDKDALFNLRGELIDLEKESEKNIPLPQQKPEENEVNAGIKNENGRQKSPVQSESEGGGSNPEVRQAAVPEHQGGQEAGELNPQQEAKPQAAPQEQPNPVRRTFKAKKVPLTINPDFEARNLGTQTGKPVDEVNAHLATLKPEDKPGGKNSESFIEFKDRIKAAWYDTRANAEDGTTIIAHSGPMRLIEAAKKVGWDDNEALMKAYNAEPEPEHIERREEKTYNGKVIIYRHPETEKPGGEEAPDLTRSPNIKLSDEGEQQAKEIADEIKAKGEEPPAIQADGMPRTHDAAEIVQEQLQKPTSNASPQSKEQQQEGNQQGGKPEHARVEQAGQQAAPAEAKGSDSNIRGGKAPEITPPSTAEQNRKKGSVVKDGITYKRNEKQTGPTGKEGSIEFSKGVDKPFQYQLVESDQLQSASIDGNRNPNHFIPEAQPKQRTDAASKESANKIAEKPDLNKVGESPNPYSGAPVVNARGEVIQGNNRAEGLVKHYEQKGDSYKKQLADNAEKYGLKKEDVEGMKNPILVRRVDVGDEEAIKLGNYDVKDIETGGKNRIDPVATSRRISPEDKEKIIGALHLDAEDKTLNAAIRDNFDKVIKLLKDHLRPAQLDALTNRSGDPSSDGLHDVEKLITHFLFDGAEVETPDHFEGLSDTAKKGLIKAFPKIFSGNDENRLIPEIQNAIGAHEDYKTSGISSFNNWKTQADMFAGGKSPQDIYTPLELKLAEAFAKAKTQKEITNLFADYAEKVNGKPGDMFGGEQKPISKTQAVKETFKVPYNEKQSRNEREAAEADRLAQETNQPSLSEDESPSGEKPNQEPSLTDAIATPAQPEEEAPVTKYSRQIAEKQSEIEAQEQLKSDSAKNLLENKGDKVKAWQDHAALIDAADKKIAELKKEQQKIQEKKANAEYDEQIKKRYNKKADEIEAQYAKNKKEHEGIASASFLGLSTKIGDHISDYIVARVADGIRALGNRHVAINRAIREAKEKFGKEASALNYSDNRKIREALGEYDKPQTHEPPLPFEYEDDVKGILSDIKDGKISYDDVIKMVDEGEYLNQFGDSLSDHVAENVKAKIHNYLEWHTQDVHELNADLAEPGKENKILNDYNMTESDKWSRMISGETIERVTGDKPENPQEVKLFELRQAAADSQNMVSKFKHHFGDDIFDWAPKMQSQIEKMDKGDIVKKVAALVGLHNELQKTRDALETQRAQLKDTAKDNEIRKEINKRLSDIPKMISAAQKEYQATQRKVSKALNEGRNMQYLWDGTYYHGQQADEAVLNKQQTEAKSKFKDKAADPGVSDAVQKAGVVRPEKAADDAIKAQQEKAAEEQKKETAKAKTKNFVDKLKEKGKQKKEKADLAELKKQAAEKLAKKDMAPENMYDKLRDLIKKNPC